MNIKYKLIIPIVMGTLLAAGCNNAVSNSQQTPAQNSQSNSTAQASGTGQKFTDQTYYKNAYLISGDTLSSDAKTALTGFTMGKQTLSSGDTQITLTAQKSEYHDQQYTLHKGNQLYFIEKFLGDDNAAANEEKNMGDDTAIVVDSQGNIVGQPQAWTTAK